MDTMGMDVVGEDMDGVDDVDGEDVDGLDVVGARGRRMKMALKGFRVKSKAFRNVSPQGVSTPREELDYLPFQVTQIQAVATAGTATTAIAFPQRPFRGERIVASAIYTPAAGAPVDASSLVVIDPAIYVGAVQVGASQGALPLSVFAATAFGVRLSVPPAGQGTRIYIPLISQIALGAGDSLYITLGMIGRAVR